MYAVFKTGGRQYKAAVGQKLLVEKLSVNEGEDVTFGEVLLLGGDKPSVGMPLVAGAKVSAKVVKQGRGPKVVIFKFRRRKNYRKKNGHRQPFTELLITGITA
ncbi:MAG: 50S ribosomal protein L21 [Polyangiaceae bacterium]|nr:50S ribosomal protein L21 [Polyangiaceae bacterium]